mmetsp:Transcript_31710/g.31010  ORF Transcript_31710/g.31010 Transcript_31710/m.31010 type:complete len:102 (-) Transcript_31710:1423-1728(-)
MLIKVPARNQLSPAKFTITMRGLDSKKTSMPIKCYLSMTQREPTAVNCDKAFHNKDSFLFKSRQKENRFGAYDSIYMSIVALQGCSVQMQVFFPKEARDDL